MNDTRRPAPLATAALLAALLAAAPAVAQAPRAGAPRAESAGFTCSTATSMVLVGMDTREGRLLLRAAGGPTGHAGWVLELAPDTSPTAGADGRWTETARYHAAGGISPYGGSIGPGPVFAVVDCGPSCLQTVRWEDGAWRPFAEPLTSPEAATVHTTYDGDGHPWVVLHAAGSHREGATAWAFRLVDREWRAAGSRHVLAAGNAEAVPDELRSDAILSGTGRFALGEQAAAWLEALPKLPPDRIGALVPVPPGAGYVSADGELFLSADGVSWARTRWTPWGRLPTRIWTPGRDFLIDVPASDHRGALSVLWFDRRRPERERLVLTEWSPRRDWRVLADLGPAVTTLDGATLDYADFFVVRPGHWLLLTGCVNTANGPGLVLRTYGEKGLSAPRFLPLQPAGEDAASGVPVAPLGE
ncbi:MAG TPA: hypothetical protein VF100_06815 [Thermoanaerobaculia bacterium]